MRESLPDKWYINTKEVPQAGKWFDSQLNHCDDVYHPESFQHISSHNNIGVKIGTDRNTDKSFSGICKGAEKITREEFLHFILHKPIDNEPLFLN